YFNAGWSAIRAVNRSVGFLMRRIEQATGISALAEISDFFTSMSGLFDNFQARIDRAYDVLRGPGTAFVVVSSPQEQVPPDPAPGPRARGLPAEGVVPQPGPPEVPPPGAGAGARRAGPRGRRRGGGRR